ncbi:MAG: hypothetical protein AAFQ53_14820 [Bacteroidota bacterium]
MTDSNHGGPRKGSGRPALPENERRSVRLSARLSANDVVALEATMEREGLRSLSDAVQWLIQDDQRRAARRAKR